MPPGMWDAGDEDANFTFLRGQVAKDEAPSKAGPSTRTFKSLGALKGQDDDDDDDFFGDFKVGDLDDDDMPLDKTAPSPSAAGGGAAVSDTTQVSEAAEAASDMPRSTGHGVGPELAAQKGGKAAAAASAVKNESGAVAAGEALAEGREQQERAEPEAMEVDAAGGADAVAAARCLKMTQDDTDMHDAAADHATAAVQHMPEQGPGIAAGQGKQASAAGDGSRDPTAGSSVAVTAAPTSMVQPAEAVHKEDAKLPAAPAPPGTAEIEAATAKAKAAGDDGIPAVQATDRVSADEPMEDAEAAQPEDQVAQEAPNSQQVPPADEASAGNDAQPHEPIDDTMQPSEHSSEVEAAGAGKGAAVPVNNSASSWKAMAASSAPQAALVEGKGAQHLSKQSSGGPDNSMAPPLPRSTSTPASAAASASAAAAAASLPSQPAVPKRTPEPAAKVPEGKTSKPPSADVQRAAEPVPASSTQPPRPTKSQPGQQQHGQHSGPSGDGSSSRGMRASEPPPFAAAPLKPNTNIVGGWWSVKPDQRQQQLQQQNRPLAPPPLAQPIKPVAPSPLAQHTRQQQRPFSMPQKPQAAAGFASSATASVTGLSSSATASAAATTAKTAPGASAPESVKKPKPAPPAASAQMNDRPAAAAAPQQHARPKASQAELPAAAGRMAAANAGSSLPSAALSKGGHAAAAVAPLQPKKHVPAQERLLQNMDATATRADDQPGRTAKLPAGAPAVMAPPPKKQQAHTTNAGIKAASVTGAAAGIAAGQQGLKEGRRSSGAAPKQQSDVVQQQRRGSGGGGSAGGDAFVASGSGEQRRGSGGARAAATPAAGVAAMMDVDDGPAAKPAASSFAEHIKRLEQMMLETQQLQDEVMLVRVQTAIASNRMTRLDNPIIRDKLAALARRGREAVAAAQGDVSAGGRDVAGKAAAGSGKEPGKEYGSETMHLGSGGAVRQELSRVAEVGVDKEGPAGGNAEGVSAPGEYVNEQGQVAGGIGCAGGEGSGNGVIPMEV